MKSAGQSISVIIIFLLGLSLAGCARVGEGLKCVAGVSTQVLEDGRKDALKEVYPYDYQACWDKIKKALVAQGAYIYAQDKKKGMIAIYVTETDTTSVGLFFTQADSTHTQVEFTSPSSDAKERIIKRIKVGLDDLEHNRKTRPPDEKKESLNLFK